MSADNILLVLQDGEKVVVYDVNFSDVSSREDWVFPVTPATAEALLTYCKTSSGCFKEWEGRSVKGAENFCLRHARQRVVEYGHTLCIPE